MRKRETRFRFVKDVSLVTVGVQKDRIERLLCIHRPGNNGSVHGPYAALIGCESLGYQKNGSIIANLRSFRQEAGPIF